MSTKRKRAINIISFGKGNAPRPKKKSNDSYQVQIKTYQTKTEHLFPFVKHFIFPLLPIMKNIEKKIPALMRY